MYDNTCVKYLYTNYIDIMIQQYEFMTQRKTWIVLYFESSFTTINQLHAEYNKSVDYLILRFVKVPAWNQPSSDFR